MTKSILAVESGRIHDKRTRPGTNNACVRKWESSARVPRGCCSHICCTRQGIDSRRRRSAQRGATSSSACAPACWSRAPSTCWSQSGVGERLQREGLVHHGIELRFGGRGHRIDMTVAHRRPRDHRLRAAGSRQGPDRGPPRRRRRDPVRSGGRGGHRPRRRRAVDPLPARRRDARRSNAISSPGATASTASAAARCPPGIFRTFERAYPFAWLGILAAAPPTHDELIYAHHDARLRALQHALARGHAPVPPGARRTRTSRAGPTRASGTSCTRAWRRPTDGGCSEGPILENGVTGMRSFVSSRCSTAGCSSRATRRTSCRRRARRG